MMADHPFDNVAVEAAARAIFTASIYQGYDKEAVQAEWWRMKSIMEAYASAALTAAFKSMKDRGMTIYAQDFVLLDELSPPMKGPVTIIRHKENKNCGD